MGQNIWLWILGAVLVIIVVGGIWQWESTLPASPTTASSEATTTSEGQTGVINRSSDTIVTVIGGIPGVSQFNSLLSNSGVSLSGKGPYTVFVSTNAGYGLLAPGTISKMTAAQKKRMVQYSIVARPLDISTTNNGQVQTLSGDTLNFVVQASGLVQANSPFALQEYKAKNGIVYVVNQPLLPPTKTQ